MIVCWVLFAISLATGLVGWAGIEYSERQAAILVAQAQEDVDAGRLPPVGTRATRFPGNEEADSLRIESTPDSRKIGSMSGPFGVVGILGGMIGGVLLLFNIILHIGHWIWMGRKVAEG